MSGQAATSAAAAHGGQVAALVDMALVVAAVVARGASGRTAGTTPGHGTAVGISAALDPGGLAGAPALEVEDLIV